MKLVDRKTFLQLPKGTVFQKYTPKMFEDLQIKTKDKYTNDFRADNPIGCIDGDDFIADTDRLENGEEVKLHFHTSFRDGLFEEDEMYAIWNKEDIQGLIERLQETL